MTNFFSHTNKIIAALALGCFFIIACENDVNEVKNLSARKTSVEEGKNIVSYLSLSGTMKAKLIAPLMLRYQGDSALKTEFPNTLYVEFFNDSTRIESKLRAKYGRYLEQENKVYLRDSVVIIRINTGDTLYTSELYWDQTAGKFYTDKPVTTIQRFTEQKIYAMKGFRSNQDLTDLTYYNVIEGSYLIIPPDSTKKN
jgi:LPS export ABC transporter protein LptC